MDLKLAFKWRSKIAIEITKLHKIIRDFLSKFDHTYVILNCPEKSYSLLDFAYKVACYFVRNLRNS